MNTPATSISADYSGEQIAYKDSTYELVSKVVFLIGVLQRIFEKGLPQAKSRLQQPGQSRFVG